MSQGSDSPDTEKRPVSPPLEEAVPKGGAEGWLRVVGAHLVYVSTWGLLNAYGSYANYYADSLLRDYSTTDIAWPGTLQAVLIVSVGVISGPFFDRGYVTTLLISGSFLVVFGMMMLSLATEYYQIILAQGICVGLGSGIVYVPSLTLVAISFPPNTRPFAIAVATCGAAVGGVVFPIALQRLLPILGFGWATRVLGFMAFACFAIGDAVILTGRKSLRPKPARSLIDWSAFKDPTFAVFCIALFFIFTAYYVPFFYIPQYVSVKLRASSDWAVYTLVITNAATAIGRLGSSFVAQRYGATETLMGAVIMSALVLFCWFAVNSTAGMDVWAVFFGIAAGPLVTVPAAVIPEISPSLGVVGTRMGMAWMFAAAGGLVGSPGFVGACMTVGVVSLIWPLRASLRRRKDSTK